VGCNHAGCVQYLYDFSSFAETGPMGSGGGTVYAIALDGSGNLFVAFERPPDGTAYNLWELPKGCTNRSCAMGLGGDVGPNGGYGQPLAIAVDGDGNVYASVADTTGTTLDEIVKVPPGCASTACVSVISGQYPYVIYSITTDQNDDVFFLGIVNNSATGDTVLYEIPNGCAGPSCVVQALPFGLKFSLDGALDNNGNFFYSNGLGQYVDEVPVGCHSTSCVITLNQQAPFLYAPQLLTDAKGNVYALSDDNVENAVLELNLTDPPTVTFPTTAQGQVSAPQTVTVSNNGNAPLAFAPSVSQANPSISQYFQLDSTSAGTCGALISASASPVLGAGQSCAMPLAFAPVAPALGTITGTSVVTDDSLNVAGAMQTIPLVGVAVLPGTTSTTLTASANPVSANVRTTLTAQVVSVSGTPTGTITFSDGATVLATVPVSATSVSGTASASYAATFVASGAHTLTASFTPSGIFLASSASLVEQVNADVAVATLTASPNPALLNASVSLAVAMSASPAGPVPTGMITFTSNGVTLGTVTLVNGTASYATTSLPAGSDSLSCNYSGDSNYAAAACNRVIETIDATPVALRLSLTSTLNPSPAFGPVSFTATLVNARVLVSGVPILFTIEGVTAGRITTGANGTATLALANGLAPGTHTVTATSAPMGVYAGESASLMENVNLVPTSTTLTAAPSSTAYGSSVVLSAVVAVNLTGAARTAWASTGLLPSGTVTFYANGVSLGTATVSGPGVAQAAQLTTTALPVGTDTITCGYSGDLSFAASSCNSAQVTVSHPPDFSIAVTPGAQTVNPGDAATYTIALAGVNGAYPLPVTLAVSGLPTGAKVNFSPGTVVPGAGPTTATMTVVTSPTQALLRRGSDVYFGLLGLPLLLVGRLRRRLRALPGNALVCVWALSMLAGVGALSGCGGGYLGSQPVLHPLTVTGSSGATIHTATASLTVR
jgi:hypothetical protein